ncbi:MAG: hypothetical protein HPY59_12735 [Anaerolineae bacterium]|nr:hypothetical protein [Anaerolineae bacterium]
MNNTGNWKTRTYIAGALIGITAGVLGAYILIQRAEQREQQPKLSAGDGVKLGLGLLGVLKLVSEFSERK